jgi:hypothetical protein
MEGQGGAAAVAYAWAIHNPTAVSCIYAENPVMRDEMGLQDLASDLKPLADAKVPILHICGSADLGYESGTLRVKKKYDALGGYLTVIVKDGVGHYPLGPSNPSEAIDFILQAGQRSTR